MQTNYILFEAADPAGEAFREIYGVVQEFEAKRIGVDTLIRKTAHVMGYVKLGAELIDAAVDTNTEEGKRKAILSVGQFTATRMIEFYGKRILGSAAGGFIIGELWSEAWDLGSVMGRTIADTADAAGVRVRCCACATASQGIPPGSVYFWAKDSDTWEHLCMEGYDKKIYAWGFRPRRGWVDCQATAFGE